MTRAYIHIDDDLVYHEQLAETPEVGSHLELNGETLRVVRVDQPDDPEGTAAVDVYLTRKQLAEAPPEAAPPAGPNDEQPPTSAPG